MFGDRNASVQLPENEGPIDGHFLPRLFRPLLRFRPQTLCVFSIRIGLWEMFGWPTSRFLSVSQYRL